MWGNNTAILGHNKTRKDKQSISICYVLARANDLERLSFAYPSGSGGGRRQNDVQNKFQVLLQLRGHLWKTHAKRMAQHKLSKSGRGLRCEREEQAGRARAAKQTRERMAAPATFVASHDLTFRIAECATDPQRVAASLAAAERRVSENLAQWETLLECPLDILPNNDRPTTLLSPTPAAAVPARSALPPARPQPPKKRPGASVLVSPASTGPPHLLVRNGAGGFSPTNSYLILRCTAHGSGEPAGACATLCRELEYVLT